MVRRLSLLVLFLAAVFGFVVYKTKGPSLPMSSTSGKPAPTPTPEPPKEVNVVSPDMKQTLIMKEKKERDFITHTFLTLGEKEKIPQQVFVETAALPETITIPFNTWSPENKYLFLKKTGKGSDSYIVLTPLGKPFRNDLKTLNVEELFSKEYTDYKITDVTGWAAPTLLVINTDNLDGSLGPSFWLDVTSLSFIKLSTRFN